MAMMSSAKMNKLKRDREVIGAEYITHQLRGHPLVVRENYRLSPALFYLLCDELNGRGLRGSADVIIEEKVAMFLQMVAQGATIRKLALDFQHSEETITRSLRMDALGAIDGTHIIAYPDNSKTFPERWRNRKGFMSQNVMAAVDFDGRFVAVDAGWEGSAHDSQVLRRAIEEGFKVPKGRYYLVDR